MQMVGISSWQCSYHQKEVDQVLGLHFWASGAHGQRGLRCEGEGGQRRKGLSSFIQRITIKQSRVWVQTQSWALCTEPWQGNICLGINTIALFFSKPLLCKSSWREAQSSGHPYRPNRPNRWGLPQRGGPGGCAHAFLHLRDCFHLGPGGCS